MAKEWQRAVGALLIAPLVALTTTSCATSAKNVTAQYVSPLQYQSYDCDQIAQEVQRIAAKVAELTGQVDDRATKDAWAMGVGLVLFWPALFFLSGGNSDKQAELSRLRGEYDALQQSAIQRHCVRAPAPSTTAAVPTGPQAPGIGAAAVETNAVGPGSVNASQPVSAIPVAATNATPTPPAPAVLVKTAGSVGGTSKYMISAEHHAKASGCAGPVATMTIAAPDYEIFTITCDKSEALLVRCDYGNCRTMH